MSKRLSDKHADAYVVAIDALRDAAEKFDDLPAHSARSNQMISYVQQANELGRKTRAELRPDEEHDGSKVQNDVPPNRPDSGAGDDNEPVNVSRPYKAEREQYDRERLNRQQSDDDAIVQPAGKPRQAEAKQAPSKPAAKAPTARGSNNAPRA